MILPIVYHPNEILERKCEKVTIFNEELAQLLDNMYETMNEADGVGLAAPQVNVAKQIAIVDVGEESGRVELINPEIIKKSGEQIGLEGCLSFPDLYGDVNRFDYVKVRAKNRFGKTFIVEADDFFARALQHEIDHLNGILFTSKVIKYYTLEELKDEEEAE